MGTALWKSSIDEREGNGRLWQRATRRASGQERALKLDVDAMIRARAFPVFASARLRRLAPTALEQQHSSADLRGLRLAVLADAGECSDCHFGEKERAKDWRFSFFGVLCWISPLFQGTCIQLLFEQRSNWMPLMGNAFARKRQLLGSGAMCWASTDGLDTRTGCRPSPPFLLGGFWQCTQDVSLHLGVGALTACYGGYPLVWNSREPHRHSNFSPDKTGEKRCTVLPGKRSS
jgi:hypothetical protein